MNRCLGCMAEMPDEYNFCPHCGYAPGTPAESALHIQPGTVLAERYLVGKVVGYGGFGVTYIAWDEVLQQRVAIKEYLPSEFATRAPGQSQVTVFTGDKAQQFADGMAKFIDEAKRLAKFQNEPGIVRIYDSFEANNTAYIVMEFLDGETLATYLKREGKIPVEQAIQMLTPVIQSLEVVHKAGIIHRDIAPDNIFLTKDKQVKLIDFGAARYATTSHSRSLTVIIKSGYSPEEQYRSRGEQGPHTDVYALAAVLYNMITGVTPPDALERRALLENKKKDTLIPPSKYCKISKNQENAILNAMNIYADARTATAKDFLSDLTSTSQVQRVAEKIRTLDLMRWPLWAKIVIPTVGVAAIAVLALLLTGVIKFGGAPLLEFTLGSDSVRVPSVINTSVGVAQDKLEEEGLSSVISGREYSETVPANMVLRQGIDAGSVVDLGTSVELYVSAAEELVIEDGLMPDLTYYTEAEATSTLEQLGAAVSVEYEYSSDVAEGLVIRTSVGMDEPLNAGDEVILYVSQGPDPAAEANPDGETPNTAGTVTLNRSSVSLYVGDTTTLRASGGNSYTWSSSNTSVATVSNGTVTAVGRGSTTIMVRSGDSTATCSVTVQDYTLSLSESHVSMFEGDSRTINAYGAPSGASVSWSSSNSRVATVSGGRITAVSSGSTTITARFTTAGRTYTDTCQVTVSSSGITLSQYSISSLYVGESETITATTSPGGQSVNWSSGNTRVVTVSNGRITAVGAGSTTITASFSYGGATYSETCSVTVREVSVSLSSSSLSMVAGESETLRAITSPSGSSVTWSSNNTGVATVSSSGRVTAVGSGTANITAEITANGQSYTDTCRVTVEEPSVRLSSSSLSMNVGDTETLSASVTPNGSSISWSSSDTSVATVSSNGRVTAVGGGTASITASITVGGKSYSDTCLVTAGSVPSYTLWVTTGSAYVGDTVRVSVRVTDVCNSVTLYSVSPSGNTRNYDITNNVDGSRLYYGNIEVTESGTWTFYASVSNDVGTYTGSTSNGSDTLSVQESTAPTGYRLYTVYGYADTSGEITMHGIGSQLTVEVIPNERNYTNITLYCVQPNGSTRTYNLGTYSGGTFSFDTIGTYTFYASVTNDYGIFTGSASNLSLRVTVLES